MKRFLVILAIFALVGTLGAAAYAAQIDSPILAGVVDTQDAELAVDRIRGDVISENFVNVVTTPGGAHRVQFDFGQVQPDSWYSYKDVVMVSNHKPYDVEVKASVLAVGGDNICDLFSPGVAHFTLTCGGAELVDYCNATGSVSLPGGSSTMCTFTLYTGGNAVKGSYSGELRFHGNAP